MAKLAELRGNVEEHFKLNERFGEEIFTVDDIKCTHDLFNLFCTAEGVWLDLGSDATPLVHQMKAFSTSCVWSCECAMVCAQADFSWRSLPIREHVCQDAAELVQHERGVPPIIHSGYSEAEYKKAKAAADAAEQQAMARLRHR